MTRRYGPGFWAVLVVLFATFVVEPRSSLDVSWQVFQGLGKFGGAVVSELASGVGAE